MKKSKKRSVKKVGKKSKVLMKNRTMEELYEDFKHTAIEGLSTGSEPDKIVEQGAAKLKEYWGAEDEYERAEIEEGLQEIAYKYNQAMTLETNLGVINGIDAKLAPMAHAVIKELKGQYKIETPQDKAYIQLAASAICRYHSNMRHFEGWKKQNFNSHERIACMGMLSRDADKAFRQYHSVIQYFEAKNKPPLKVSVNAKTAFIAQNQQNVATNPKKDENNECQ